MNILIKVSGHQQYYEITGEVIIWTTGVEYFSAEPMQVPCVLVLTKENKIEVVNLRSKYLDYEIIKLNDVVKTEFPSKRLREIHGI